eukprot:CAMPEP_0201589182 /NCGR_PEP_ID=MMETSP0190_2-20130828/163745_1 /ASSEMBLY_ACC=CAM_ASM_000263 /TAXON_ID=37353 /ORGANISM="Rosalina sp." /LENGTH=73 /DNA_ID=CAMNT_0048042835 /DNA_START=52 /DNA_END=273 /DNA_ORIENTATION=+
MGFFSRIFWFGAGVGTGIYLDQTRTWMPRMDNLVNKYRQKWEPTVREVTGDALRIFNEEKKKLEQDNENKNKD